MQPYTGHVLTQSADFNTERCEPSRNPYLQDIAELQQQPEAVHWVTALCCCCEADQFWFAILIVILFPNLHTRSHATKQHNI
jgi:hypothetical protein